jgi:hypothetical protein
VARVLLSAAIDSSQEAPSGAAEGNPLVAAIARRLASAY